MGDRPDQTHNINWHSMQFDMQPGDTIYAVRAGQVIQITKAEAEDDPSLPFPDGRITFKRNVNRVWIEHADGSYADYSVLGDIAVHLGDRVWPHTPIGLAGSYDGKIINSGCRFTTTDSLPWARPTKNPNSKITTSVRSSRPPQGRRN
jgi:murein DD-endopeptidase MepM/ murein hydrolase activator NlpD